MGAMQPFDMPAFRDPDGSVWEWDESSHTYVQTTSGDVNDRPDRGHATGGDNDLFDPFVHTEMSGVPELEGHMAASEWAPKGHVKCPNCQEATDDPVCPTCGKDLTPEWNQEQSNEFLDVMPQHSDASEFTSWPEREPKRNRLNTDDSYPSMTTGKVGSGGLSEQHPIRCRGGLHFGPLGFLAPMGQFGFSIDGKNVGAEDAMYDEEDGGIYYPGQPERTISLSANSGDPQLDRDMLTVGKHVIWHGEPHGQFGKYPPVSRENITGLANGLRKHWGENGETAPHLRLSKYELTEKIAHRRLSQDEWDELFSDGGAKTEVGKWLQTRDGHLFFDHGMHALHEEIAKRNQVSSGDLAALGSVYNDGSADVQRVFPSYQFDLQSTQGQIEQAFGPVTLQPPVGQDAKTQRGHAFEPVEITGGQWVIAPPFARDLITGMAWVKERPEGQGYKSNMILVAEHLQPDDFALWSQGVTAIVTATGGLSSHAAYLAVTEGIPVVVGIGEPYNKIETGNYLKVDPITHTITVMPGGSTAMTPDQKQDVWDTILQYQRQRGGSLKPEYFSHIDDELAWRAANTPTLDGCPECRAPMIDQDSEKVCHDCGHKQPIITAAVLAGVAAIGLAGGAEAGGLAGGLSGIGGLMTKALGSPGMSAGINAERLMGGGGGGGGAPVGEPTPLDTGAETQGVISSFGEEEVGTATKNRGDDSNPDTQGSSGSDSEEHGDSPEQLKDVDGGAATQGDPELQSKAMKAFHMNLPLVIEFSNTDEPGIDNPILRALDELLEEAYPGYKDGHDQESAEDEHPVEEINAELHPEEKTDDESSDEKSDPKEASVWHYAMDYDEADQPTWEDMIPHEAAAWGDPQMPMGGFPQNNGDLQQMQMQPQMQQQPGASCPMCGQSHLPGTPCPTPANVTAPAATGAPIGPPQPNSVVTKWQVVALDPTPTAPTATDAPIDDWSVGDVIAAYPDGTIVLDDGITTHNMQRAQEYAAQHGWSKDPNQQQVPFEPVEPSPLNGGPFDEPIERSPLTASFDPEFAFFTAAGEGEHHRVHEVKHKPGEAPGGDDAADVHTPDDPQSVWIDESGAPLQDGADYELKSSDYAIPDRITIDRVLPDKLVFTIHSGDVDYRDEITVEDIQTNGYSFAPVGLDDSQVDSIDGFQPEAPIRPGQDALPQQDDLSTPSTVVSSLEEYTGSYNGDAPDARSWLIEGGSSEAVDPTLMAKLAGKDFSPREQREFIDESGEARNLDRLDLSGTHYITDDLSEAFNW